MSNNNLSNAYSKIKSESMKLKEKSKELAKKTSAKVNEVMPIIKDNVKNVGQTIGDATLVAMEKSKPVVKKAIGVASKTIDNASELAIKAKDEIMKIIDQNGNGQIDIEDIIILSLKTPGVKVDRKSFLNKELKRGYPQEIIDKAIETTPALAGIKSEDVYKIADEVIKAERNVVSGISAALGAPGGVAIIATIPTDIAQYYGSMIKVMQKLLYLYGFPEINVKEGEEVIDAVTLNELTICLGIMYGVAGANEALKSVAKALALGVEKKLINKALTKTTFYPIVKKIAAWFGKKMTKEVFAGFFKNAIPVVGAALGGGITFFSFKPCCDLLKNSLQETILSNPSLNNRNGKEAIDVEFNGIE